MIILTYKTHSLLGLALSILLAGASFLGGFIALISSLLPDLDHRESYLSWNFPFLSKIVHSRYEHRGITHSLFSLLFLSLLFWFISPNYANYFFIGYGSHLLADSITPAGIPLLYPREDRFSFDIIKTGSDFEYVIQGFALAILASLFLY